MVKYSKQLNETDCGPMAVLNTLKWAGYKVSTKRGYKSIKRSCEWSPGTGTWVSDVVRTLRKYSKLKTRVLVRPSMKDLDSLLDKGYVFILRYTHDDGSGGHFSLCIGKSDKKFFFINDSSIKTDRARLRKTVNCYLRKIYRKEGWYAPARVICVKKTKNNPTFPFKNI